jgi:hypothetical protein
MSFRSRSALAGALFLGAVIFLGLMVERVRSQSTNQDSTANNAVQLVTLGRQIFRFDTFGDQAFWGDTLKLHQESVQKRRSPLD